jgi:hypothetical protein
MVIFENLADAARLAEVGRHAPRRARRCPRVGGDSVGDDGDASACSTRHESRQPHRPGYLRLDQAARTLNALNLSRRPGPDALGSSWLR